MIKYGICFALCLIAPFYAIESMVSAVKINWSEVKGSFYYEGQGFYEGDPETQLLERYPFKPGDVVLDVGAHTGEWASLTQRFSPFIDLYCFEPGPTAYSLLKARNPDMSEKLFNIAISNRLGTDTFFVLDEGTFLSGLISRPLFASGYRQIQVPLETIDHFCEVSGIEKIEYLKIDTEGAELRVLQGAQNMLSKHKIRALQFEYGEAFYDAKITLEQVIQLLTQAGYAIFLMEPSGLVSISSWRNSLENYAYVNFFAILYSEVPKCPMLTNLYNFSKDPNVDTPRPLEKTKTENKKKDYKKRNRRLKIN